MKAVITGMLAAATLAGSPIAKADNGCLAPIVFTTTFSNAACIIQPPNASCELRGPQTSDIGKIATVNSNGGLNWSDGQTSYGLRYQSLIQGQAINCADWRLSSTPTGIWITNTTTSHGMFVGSGVESVYAY